MNIPEELARLRQWIVWRDEDGRKIPYQTTGAKAKSNDPATWGSLEAAQAARGFSGLGFVFADGGGLWGMDLDGCRDPQTGALAEWAECILNELATYAEVSPSGTGVKIWGRGSFGAGRRIPVDEERICSKAPAIEIYSKGRYFTFTGQRVGDWVLRDVDPSGVLKEFERDPEPVLFVPPDRAKAYIDNVPGCGEGSRNQTAFRLSACLVNDFALPVDSAWSHLCSWNARNMPPLKENELRACLASAGRNSKRPPGEKAQEALVPDSVGELAAAAFLRPKAAPPEPSLSPDCLAVPGLIGDIVDYNLRTAMYPQPELALAGALALLSVITGRKICDDRRTRTNIYVLGIAPTGSGKENARTVNKDILIQASSEGEKMLGPERVGSSAGLVSSVHSQPAVLFQIDEFGKMLATMKNAAKSPHLYNIGSVLMQMYSSSSTIWIADAYADLKKTKRIVQPHACLYGTGTPEDFWGSLSKESIEDGLLGRILTFEGRYADRKDPEPAEVPGIILERVRKWLELRPEGGGNIGAETNPKCLVVPYEPEAKRRLDSHLDGICERRKNETGSSAAIWSRVGEKTSKLALLFACSRWTGEASTRPTVELADVNRAIKIANYLTRKMLRMAHEHVSENDTESKSKKLLRLIVGELTMSDLTRKTQWLRARERAEILSDLQAANYIEVKQKDTGGRPVTYLKRRLEISDY